MKKEEEFFFLFKGIFMSFDGLNFALSYFIYDYVEYNIGTSNGWRDVYIVS